MWGAAFEDTVKMWRSLVLTILIFVFSYVYYMEMDLYIITVITYLIGWFSRDLFYESSTSSNVYVGGYRELDHKVLNLKRTETPWMNLGKWDEAKGKKKTYAEACRDLARAVGDAAELNKGVVLDVGFGRGAQLLMWSQEYGVRDICGVNISKAEVEHAKRLVNTSTCTTKSRFDLRVGDATNLPWKEKHFDRVLAMDCAYHFVTRENFFREARRVLRQDGKLVLADMVLKSKPQGIVQNLLIRVICFMSGIPRENLLTTDEYVSSLERNHFSNVKVLETFDVGSGFLNFMKRHEKEWGDVVRSDRMGSLRHAAWFISKCPIEMCVVRANVADSPFAVRT